MASSLVRWSTWALYVAVGVMLLPSWSEAIACKPELIAKAPKDRKLGESCAGWCGLHGSCAVDLVCYVPPCKGLLCGAFRGLGAGPTGGQCVAPAPHNCSAASAHDL
eukprot:RCo049003